MNFDPLSAIINLIEKGSDFFKYKRERKRSFFNEIINPLFAELEKVAEDYFKLFSEAEKFYLVDFKDYEETQKNNNFTEPKVNSESNTQFLKEFEQFVNTLRQYREKLLLTRIKVRKMSTALSENTDEELLISFSKAVEEYFFGTDVPVMMSNGKQIVELFEQLQVGGIIGGHDTLYFIRKTKDKMETSWGKISKYYQLLKLKYR